MVHDFFFTMTPYTYYLHRIPVGQRYSMTIGIVIVLTSMWFIGIYQPLCSSIVKTQALLHEAQQNHIQEKILSQEINHLEKTYTLLNTQLTQECKNFESYTPINKLIDGAHNAHLSLISHKLINTHHKKWHSDKQYITEFCGPYSNLINFFRTLEQVQCLVKPEKIVIYKSNLEALTCHCEYSIIALKEQE